MTTDENNFTYEIALSFAGEDRVYAERLAQLLKKKGIKIFYDETEAADLWGKDLIAHLADVYGKKARFCVMFVSRHYPLKRWTNHERLHAQARAFRDPSEYILPLRLDDTEVPGLPDTIGYMDLRHRSIERIAELLEQKLAKSKGIANASSVTHFTAPGSLRSTSSSIPMPKTKKTFTQLEKDRFTREAFDYIRQYFQQGLQKLESHDSDVDTYFTEEGNSEFACKIYVQGRVVSECAIWLGDNHSLSTIYYSQEMRRLGQFKYSDYLPVEESGEGLRLRIGLMAVSIVKVDEPLATKEQSAIYLWKRLIYRLEQH